MLTPVNCHKTPPKLADYSQYIDWHSTNTNCYLSRMNTKYHTYIWYVHIYDRPSRRCGRLVQTGGQALYQRLKVKEALGGGGVGSTTLHTTATSSGPPVKVRALLGLCERRSFVKNCSQILDCVPQRALQVNLSLATGWQKELIPQTETSNWAPHQWGGITRCS